MEGICISLREKAGLFRGNTNLSGVLHGASECKQSACNAMQEFNPCVRKIPQRREWLPTPVFFPGEFHGQKTVNLVELGLGGGGK